MRPYYVQVKTALTWLVSAVTPRRGVEVLGSPTCIHDSRAWAHEFDSASGYG
jgi:hypothetical protein